MIIIIHVNRPLLDFNADAVQPYINVLELLMINRVAGQPHCALLVDVDDGWTLTRKMNRREKRTNLHKVLDKKIVGEFCFHIRGSNIGLTSSRPDHQP